MILANTQLKPADYKQIRRFAVQFVYQQEINQQFSMQNSIFEMFTRQTPVPQEHKPFLNSLLTVLYANLRQIDSTIEKNAINWKISRIAKVDLAILRVATVELMHREDTDTEVILAEAAALASEFGSENSAGFVNGILDTISKEVRKK